MDYVLVGRTGIRVSRRAGHRRARPRAAGGRGRRADRGCARRRHQPLRLANTYGSRASFDRDGLPAASERKHAEELLGRALKGRRDDVVLCTKVSEPVGEGPNDGGMILRGLRREGRWAQPLPHHARGRAEPAPPRHRPHRHLPPASSRPRTAIEETLRATDDLVTQGKVRYVGLSTYNGWQLTQAVMTADHLGLRATGPEPGAVQPREPVARSRSATRSGRDRPHAHLLQPPCGGALAGAAVMDRQYSGLRRWGMPFDYPPEQKQAALELDALATGLGAEARSPRACVAAVAAGGRSRDHRPRDARRAASRTSASSTCSSTTLRSPRSTPSAGPR